MAQEINADDGELHISYRKVQAKRRLLKMRFVLHSPQHGMDWQL